MFEPKYVVRKGTLFNRQMLADAVWAERNEKICRQAKAFLDSNDIGCFHVFLPIRRNKEVDLWGVLNEAVNKEREAFVSATDFEQGTMSHFIYTKELTFKEDQFGIPTPQGGEAADLKKLELIFIPMLAGDKKGNRVGYGKGYYDRLLTEMPSSLLKVGVSLNPLFDHFTFAEPHDIALDYCITPWEVVKCQE